jgi:hypothetical protein
VTLTDAVLEPGKTSEMPNALSNALPKQLPFAKKSETFKKMWFHMNTRAVKSAKPYG